jgi:hypothetical protein
MPALPSAFCPLPAAVCILKAFTRGERLLRGSPGTRTLNLPCCADPKGQHLGARVSRPSRARNRATVAAGDLAIGLEAERPSPEATVICEPPLVGRRGLEPRTCLVERPAGAFRSTRVSRPSRARKLRSVAGGDLAIGLEAERPSPQATVICEAPLVGRRGLEPRTCGLRVRCSAKLS